MTAGRPWTLRTGRDPGSVPTTDIGVTAVMHQRDRQRTGISFRMVGPVDRSTAISVSTQEVGPPSARVSSNRAMVPSVGDSTT